MGFKKHLHEMSYAWVVTHGLNEMLGGLRGKETKVEQTFCGAEYENIKHVM